MRKKGGRQQTEEEFLGGLFKEKISRRKFLKIAAGACAIGVGGYAFAKLLQSERSSGVFRGDAPKELWKWNKEGMHYTARGATVHCETCPNQCVLFPGDRGACRNKVNVDGKQYTLAYGNPCSINIDPIEKKPLFHFLPGTNILSIATAGCTFRCMNCQNWQISQKKPEELVNRDAMPEIIAAEAQLRRVPSIAYTYSEPIAFYEYAYDTGKEAKKRGVRNVWVTNGSINKKALEDASPYIDAANVDLKAFSDATYQELNGGWLKPVLEALKVMKERNIWLELTWLMVPTWTDSMDEIREGIQWVKNNLGADVPIHFSRFNPMYKLEHLPATPVKKLMEARKMAMDEGMHYVYIGNILMPDSQNTYCPDCEKVVIERKGFKVITNHVKEGICGFCGQKIAGVWK